jgi:hypothetical protein
VEHKDQVVEVQCASPNARSNTRTCTKRSKCKFQGATS